MRPDKVLGVTLGWGGNPVICWMDSEGQPAVLPDSAEFLLHGEYYPHGPNTWPIDHPDTGEKITIWHPESFTRKTSGNWVYKILSLFYGGRSQGNEARTR